MKWSCQHVDVQRIDPLGLGVDVHDFEQVLDWDNAVIAACLDHVVVGDVYGIAIP